MRYTTEKNIRISEENRYLSQCSIFQFYKSVSPLTKMPNDERTGDKYKKRQPFCRGNVEWKWCSTAG